DRPAFFFAFPRQSDGVRHFAWYGLNNRYDDYWVAILHGDLGTSFRTDCPVAKAIFWSCGVQEIRWGDVSDDLRHVRFASLVHRIDPFFNSRFFSTVLLAITALVIAVVIAIPFGVIAGKNRGTLKDNALSVVALVGISLPSFVIGPMLVYIFAVKLGWLSPSGRFDWSDIILPAFTLGAAMSAILTRMVRSSVIEEMGESYVRTARAKGLSESKVVYKHVLKNGLIPVVTVLGLQLGVLLAGAIITEKIFGWPGLGLLLVEDGIGKRDYAVVQGCVLAISTTYIIANTLTDMVYRWLDPRIRVS
ncbi:MAG TPA: ABC transporter permease, partial [Pyrinomonadaceae bacterium]|nr:ABC transporter permease [Pyrinomonadaceae bacterium]